MKDGNLRGWGGAIRVVLADVQCKLKEFDSDIIIVLLLVDEAKVVE